MLKRDILESYSKHHNRKLAILEQDEAGVVDPARLAAAVEALKKAGVWKKTGEGAGASFAGMVSGRQYYFSPTKRKISGGTGAPQTAIGLLDDSAAVGADGTLTFASLEADPAKGKRGITNLKTLISSLIGDYAGGATAEAKRQQIAPGSLLSQVDNDTLSDSEKTAITSNLENIVQNLPGYWENGMSTEQKEAYGSIENYQSKFVGQKRDSFEKKLLEDKLDLTLKDGEWIASERPVDGYQSIYVSKSLSDLVRVAAGGDPSEEACANVLRDFAGQNGTDRIIISPKGEGADRTRALSFSDPQRTLRNLVRSVANKCNPGEAEDSDAGIRMVDVRAVSTSDRTGDNAIRGFMMEEILEVLSLLEARQKGREGKGTENLNLVIARKFSKIKERLLRLREEVETWVTASKFSGLDPKQAQLVHDLKQIADNMDPENPIQFDKDSLFGSMFRHSRTCLMYRKPTFVLPVGTETKRGKRQDVLEVYKTKEEAMAAAERVGVAMEPEEHENLDTALRGATGIVKEEGDSLSMAQVLEDSGVFSPDQKVYTLKVSLKNYKKFEGHGASMGGGRKRTLPDIVQVEGNEFDNEFMKTIQSVADIDNPRQFKKYFDSVAKISSAVIDLGTSRYAQARGPGKGRVKIDNLKSLEKTLTSTLKNQGLDLMPHAKEISQLLERMTQQKSYSDLESEATYRKAQMTVIRYLEDTKLYNDINKGASVNNPNPRQVRKRRQALQYLATRMMHAGGADDDETLCDYRGLNTSRDYIFKQNDPMREAWSSILKDDGEWMLDTGEEEGNFNGGFKLTKRGTNASLNFEYSIEPSKEKGQVVDFFGQFETRMNKGALEYFNVLPQEEQRKAESTVNEAFKHIMLALSLLQEKVTVVD